MRSFVIVQINRSCWALNPLKNIWIIPLLVEHKIFRSCYILFWLNWTNFSQHFFTPFATLSMAKHSNISTECLEPFWTHDAHVAYFRLYPGRGGNILEHWQGAIVEVVSQSNNTFHPKAVFKMTKIGCISQINQWNALQTADEHPNSHGTHLQGLLGDWQWNCSGSSSALSCSVVEHFSQPPLGDGSTARAGRAPVSRLSHAKVKPDLCGPGARFRKRGQGKLS